MHTLPVMVDETCTLCGSRIRKVNGRITRYKYEIGNLNIHRLGGRVVRNHRKDPGLDWGCAKCYEGLASEQVPYNSLQTKIFAL